MKMNHIGNVEMKTRTDLEMKMKMEMKMNLEMNSRIIMEMKTGNELTEGELCTKTQSEFFQN